MYLIHMSNNGSCAELHASDLPLTWETLQFLPVILNGGENCLLKMFCSHFDSSSLCPDGHQCFDPTTVAQAPREVRRQAILCHLVSSSHPDHLYSCCRQQDTKSRHRNTFKGRRRENTKFSLHCASSEPEGAMLQLPPGWSCLPGKQDFSVPMHVWTNAAELAGWGQGATPGKELALFTTLQKELKAAKS